MQSYKTSSYTLAYDRKKRLFTYENCLSKTWFLFNYFWNNKDKQTSFTLYLIFFTIQPNLKIGKPTSLIDFNWLFSCLDKHVCLLFSGGAGCTAYDVVVHPDFFDQLQKRQILMGFFLTVVLEGLEHKFELNLCRGRLLGLLHFKRQWVGDWIFVCHPPTFSICLTTYHFNLKSFIVNKTQDSPHIQAFNLSIPPHPHI